MPVPCEGVEGFASPASGSSANELKDIIRIGLWSPRNSIGNEFPKAPKTKGQRGSRVGRWDRHWPSPNETLSPKLQTKDYRASEFSKVGVLADLKSMLYEVS